MKFVVDDVAATPDAGGVYSILSDFYMDVIKNDHENEWFFILAGKYFPESKNVKIIKRSDLKHSKAKKLLFERLYGHKLINSLNPDIYISLQNIATYNVNAKKQIVYLHQPVPFQKEKKFSFFKKNETVLATYQHLIGKFIKMSISQVQPTVIVQTKWMKRVLLEQTKAQQDEIVIAHPQINSDTNLKKYHGDGKKFFYPASNFMYKNHELIYKAIKLLKKDDISNFKVDFTLNKDQLEYKDPTINYIGHISRQEVMKMYDTHVLLFPSYIESFGLPLIEAALHADIILAADTEFSRELLANYTNVYYYPYNDPKKLANLMEDVIKGKIKSNQKSININSGESLLDTIKKLVNKNDKV